MASGKADSAMLQAVLRFEEERRQAMLTGDSTKLQALLADDLVYVHSTAASDSKTTYLAKLQSGRLKYLSLQFDDLQARVAGQCVVVTGRMSAEVSKDGQPRLVSSLFMTVWSADSHGSEPVRWKLQAHQGTPVNV